MPIIPTLTGNAASRTSREVTDTFYGYDHRLKIGDGYFYDTKNLTTAHFPMLSPRNERSMVLDLRQAGATRKITGLHEKDALAYVEGGTLYYNMKATGLTGLSNDEKQIVSMGAYILIWPDKVYYNTASDGSDYGSIEADWNNAGAAVTYTMCRSDGTVYEKVAVAAEKPDSSEAELWVKTVEGSTQSTIYAYSESESTWVELETAYTKLTFTTHGVLPALFRQYDAVQLSGSSYELVNGSKIIYAVGGSATENDWIVVVNPLNVDSIEKTGETIRLERKAPKMNYICEANNRIWGCYYGLDEDGNNVNEIRCCALGDFRNWEQYMGLSTDSYAANVGTDGQWTGAVNYLGQPVFFKERHIHIVSVSSYGAHQITELPARGVQKGSHKSLCIVNETLYYKSRTDICAWNGSFPESVSAALGDSAYYDAVAGSFGERYYISMRDKSNAWALFCYDIRNGLWVKEDDLHVSCFAAVDDSMYAVTENGKLLLDLNGVANAASGAEGEFEWIAETGMLYYVSATNKYVQRFNFAMKGDKGTEITCYIQYDSDGKWLNKGTIKMNGINTVTLPITPKRCDHLQLKLVGKGPCRVFSIAKILEVGSDI